MFRSCLSLAFVGLALWACRDVRAAETAAAYEPDQAVYRAYALRCKEYLDELYTRANRELPQELKDLAAAKRAKIVPEGTTVPVGTKVGLVFFSEAARA